MSNTKDKVLYMLSSSGQIGSIKNTIRQLINSVRPNSNIEVTSPDIMQLREDLDALKRNNKELLDQRFQLMDELALLRHERAMDSIMAGHYKSELNIHTEESQQFIKEATDKIKVLQAKFDKCKEQRNGLISAAYRGNALLIKKPIDFFDEELDSITIETIK